VGNKCAQGVPVDLCGERLLSKTVEGGGTTLHGDRRKKAGEVKPRRSDGRAWPINEHDAVIGEEDVVRTNVCMDERRTGSGLGVMLFDGCEFV
jgi:hypothetical protein